MASSFRSRRQAHERTPDGPPDCSESAGIDRFAKTILNSLNALENKPGTTLLAFSCHDLKPSVLKADDLRKIQGVEAKPGVSPVAVEA